MTLSVPESVRNWMGGSIQRKLAVVLAVGLAIASLGFLMLIVASYRDRVLEERSMASLEINRLLQVALENAMLNRDIPGLAGIVERLGRQDKIAGVMILAPGGEVRFSSQAGMVGQRFDMARGELCPGCGLPLVPTEPKTAFLTDPKRGEVLRSINPVHNREPCVQCHGAISAHPVNGILVVDYDARQISHDTMVAALTLGAAGLSVLFAVIGGVGWMLNRVVIAPVARLSAASGAITQGRLGERVTPVGHDEIAALGASFNAMASRIEHSMHDVESRERYLQAVLDAMPDGVRVIDESYRVVNANSEFAAQHGRAISEVVGRTCYQTSHARNEPCPATLVTCPLDVLSKSAGPLICRHRHVRADGREIQMEVSAAALDIEVEPGKRRHLIVEVCRDLSKDLKVSQEQRLSEIGFLAAGVAHEICNPLASIQLGLASLNRAASSGSPEQAADYIRVIEGEIGRCIAITSRLLKLSASPGERRELVVLGEIVTDVLSLLNAEVLKSGVAFVNNMPPDLRVIASDGEMRMLVLNLAQNALHAMPNGGHLTITGRRSGNQIILTFADTGVGIAPENLARVFDPFWSRRADGVQGTGLGLSICREILKSSGGQISVTSELGKGTIFEVTLPAADREEQSQ